MAATLEPSVATPANLSTFLNRSVDLDRANLVLYLAEQKCTRYVHRIAPAKALTVEVLDVILTVAGRAYSNVTSAHQAGIGSANISFGAQNSSMGVGGLYLSRSDKADLRRFAGNNGAWSKSLLPDGWGQA